MNNIKLALIFGLAGGVIGVSIDRFLTEYQKSEASEYVTDPIILESNNKIINATDNDIVKYLLNCDLNDGCTFMGSIAYDWYNGDESIMRNSVLISTLDKIDANLCPNVTVASVIYENWSDGNSAWNSQIIADIINSEAKAAIASSGEYPYVPDSSKAQNGTVNVFCTKTPKILSVG